MSELADKERRAIKILRMYRGDNPIEVSYSGGKDICISFMMDITAVVSFTQNIVLVK